MKKKQYSSASYSKQKQNTSIKTITEERKEIEAIEVIEEIAEEAIEAIEEVKEVEAIEEVAIEEIEDVEAIKEIYDDKDEHDEEIKNYLIEDGIYEDYLRITNKMKKLDNVIIHPNNKEQLDDREMLCEQLYHVLVKEEEDLDTFETIKKKKKKKRKN